MMEGGGVAFWGGDRFMVGPVVGYGFWGSVVVSWVRECGIGLGSISKFLRLAFRES